MPEIMPSRMTFPSYPFLPKPTNPYTPQAPDESAQTQPIPDDHDYPLHPRRTHALSLEKTMDQTNLSILQFEAFRAALADDDNALARSLMNMTEYELRSFLHTLDRLRRKAHDQLM